MCDFPSHFVLEERFLNMGWVGGRTINCGDASSLPMARRLRKKVDD